jgi:hypothetical protein
MAKYAVPEYLRTTPPPERRPGEHLNDYDSLNILWCLSQKWSDPKIARKLNAHASTIMRFRVRLYRNPTGLFRLPALWTTSSTKACICGFCGGERRAGTGIKRHVLSHFFTLGRARVPDLTVPSRLL